MPAQKWSSWRARMRRRPSLPQVCLAGTGVLLITAMVLPAPFVVESAGPTFNTVGEHQGKPLLEITNAKTYPTDSQLDLTTVYVKGGPAGQVSAANVIYSWLHPHHAVVPRDTMYPPDLTGREVEESNSLAMESSQESSVAAALSYLDRPYTTDLTVHAASPGSPAEKVLKKGDRLLKVDGTPVETLTQLREQLDQAGEKGVRLTVVRDGKELTRHVDLKREGQHGPWQLGVFLIPEYDFPVDVKFALEQVGGPSAGMMFAVGIVDELTPGSLAKDAHIAGTGTITPDGRVGPIGGIRQKLQAAAEAGAGYFLAPSDNCDEVRGHVPDGVDVVEVKTLSDAVAAAELAGAGNVSALPSCGTR